MGAKVVQPLPHDPQDGCLVMDGQRSGLHTPKVRTQKCGTLNSIRHGGPGRRIIGNNFFLWFSTRPALQSHVQ